MTQPTSDIRTLLLAALGLGEWEAEHLAGVDLVRQVVELLAWYRRELHATMVRLQRLAIDVQDLQSGEAWDQMRQEMYEVEVENRRLHGLLAEAPRVFVPLAEWAEENEGAPARHMGVLLYVGEVHAVVEWARRAGVIDDRVCRCGEPMWAHTEVNGCGQSTVSTGGPLPSVLDGED